MPLRSFQYLAVLGACLLVTLPLELVLGARVWRRPRRLAGALAAPFVVFVAWDLWAAAHGQWRFSRTLATSWRLPFGVPVDELLFFVVVPICGLLTLEAVRTLSKRRR
jgi:lycopene cyclase domain-containing protein